MVKSHKISNWIFLALIAASLVVFLMFYMVGYENPQGNYNAPQYTDLLIKFMYFMAGACVVAAVGGAVLNAVANVGGPKGINVTGVPDKAISVGSVVLFIATLVISWAMASDAPVTLPSGDTFNDVALLKLTDLCVYSIYILLAIAGLALVVNLTGIFKKMS